MVLCIVWEPGYTESNRYKGPPIRLPNKLRNSINLGLKKAFLQTQLFVVAPGLIMTTMLDVAAKPSKL